MNEQAAELDASTEHPPQLEYAVASSEPPEHGRRVRNLLPAAGHGNPEKRGMRFGSEAVHSLAQRGVHPVGLYRGRRQLSLDILRRRQLVAQRAETCQTTARDRSTQWELRMQESRRWTIVRKEKDRGC